MGGIVCRTSKLSCRSLGRQNFERVRSSCRKFFFFFLGGDGDGDGDEDQECLVRLNAT